MVLFNLISRIPMVNIDTNDGMILHNRLVIMISAGIYVILWALLYYNKIPTTLLAKIPFVINPKYILLIMIIDYCSYMLLHRYLYGFFPLLSLKNQDKPQSIPNSNEIKCPFKSNEMKSNEMKSNEMEIESNEMESDKIPINLTSNNDKKSPIEDFKPPSPPDDDYILENSNKATLTNIDDIDNVESEMESMTDVEMSITDKDYFKEDKKIVENWDVEEFLPDDYSK